MVVTMKQLLEAGVHFGHQTRRWNPKMKPYIFAERNNIYIIDLQKTVELAEKAYNFVRDLAREGGTFLFVGTKKQAQEAIEQEAKRCGMFYVNQRWLGGMLTNFSTICQSIERLKKIEEMELDKFPVCMAKTQYSLSDDPSLLGRPRDFNITVKEVRVSAGAGFIVALTGDIMTMPGLPKVPSAEKIDITPDGVITGLF